MTPAAIDARALAQSGVAALSRGDAREARAMFEAIDRAGAADASICLGLAIACRLQGDRVSALAAVTRALALEPRNLRALIFKADELAAAGDELAASEFYRAAVAVAPPAQELPADLAGEIARAQDHCARQSARFSSFLRERMQSRGAAGFEAGSRFAQSLDILSGTRQVYFQQPRHYYFPELPQIQFYERSRFPWLDEVEAATPAIREELRGVLANAGNFTPYVAGDPDRPHTEQSGMRDNPDWSAFYLWKDGALVEENAARCPRTLAALAHAPLATITGRSPSVLFSQLRAGARIPPHHGMINTRLICHLPLIVPAGCGLRVGNDTREPVEGKAWVFDDTIEHEAFNGGEGTRVILLFEIWRPELTLEERGLVNAMFEAIAAYGGTTTDWSI